MRISTVIILMGALAAGGAVWVGQRNSDSVVVSSIASTPSTNDSALTRKQLPTS